MYGPDGEDVFYYLTLYNEALPQPAMPEGVREGILKGIYRYSSAGGQAHLLRQRPAIHWALAAQRLLQEEYGVGVDVWSVTSWSELRRDAMTSTAVPYPPQALAGTEGPVIAVSDWMPRRAGSEISPWIDRPWTSLGTDGFGSPAPGVRTRALRRRPAFDRRRRARVPSRRPAGDDRPGFTTPAAEPSGVVHLRVDDDPAGLGRTGDKIG